MTRRLAGWLIGALLLALAISTGALAESLPDYYGLFVVNKDEAPLEVGTTEDQQPTENYKSIRYFLFDKNVGFGLYKDFHLIRLKYLRQSTDYSQVTFTNGLPSVVKNQGWIPIFSAKSDPSATSYEI